MFRKFGLAFLFLSLVGDIIVTSQNAFRARPQDITATVGSSVKFRCKVTELSINQAVAWMKSDRAGLATEWLTSGNDVIAPEPLAGRIKIVGTGRSNLRYDIMIKNVQYTDDGLYICNILTFGDVGITTQRRSNGNVLRIIPDEDEHESATEAADARGSTRHWLPATSTLYCSGIDYTMKVLVGEIITLRCIKWIHQYADRRDGLTLKWIKNNRTIASEMFEPDLPQVGGKVVTLLGENLTVEFTFRVEHFDSNATFTCESEERERYQRNEVCHLGPLRVTSTSEFILAGKSVAYVEEGDGVKLYCPRPLSETIETRKRQIVWMQGPLLDRDRYAVTSDTMYIYRLQRADDGLRVSCSLHSSRRTVLLGETVVRVTINGDPVSSDNTRMELLETTTETSAFTFHDEYNLFSSDNENHFYGSGAELGEFPGSPTEITPKFVTSKFPMASYTSKIYTTYRETSPPQLTTKGTTTLPHKQQPGDRENSDLVDTFKNFKFPSDDSDWSNDGDSGFIDIHTTPSNSPTSNDSRGFLYTISHLDKTTVYILIFMTPAAVLIFVLLCVTLLICGPTNRFNRSWSNYGKTSERRQPPQTFVESVWATKSHLERPPPSPSKFQLFSDTDGTLKGKTSVASTHIYESTSRWTSDSVSTSHFERHSKLKTFGPIVNQYDHLQRMDNRFDKPNEDRQT